MTSAPTDLQDEIHRLQRALQERDDLLALTAHELRNPLHSLSLQLRLARMAAEGGDAPEALGRVAKAEVMLERYVERLTLLLDLTRLNAEAYPVRLRTVDLTRTLASLVDTLAAEAQYRHVQLQLEAPERCELTTDPAIVEQIVGNLMLNAFKHAACQHVTLTLQPAQDNTVLVSVADDGRGIAPQDQQRIFGKFAVAQDGPRGTGSGLGLWIVRKLLAVLGGSITLSSRPQAGSTFTLRLPTVYRADNRP
ncbi:sensor histidine kinase [Ideonella sp. BN130291]|uniref:sensor histidine kinase n=1 Tax=Ideonella sp. BN130291 TaxID=3112940 RepID=UPI002E276640|nr:HAMP domain-containing sensor histidine kinase [Ideonella sp. BN130291]